MYNIPAIQCIWSKDPQLFTVHQNDIPSVGP